MFTVNAIWELSETSKNIYDNRRIMFRWTDANIGYKGINLIKSTFI